MNNRTLENEKTFEKEENLTISYNWFHVRSPPMGLALY